MYYLIYASSATVPFSRADLTTLLEISRRNNVEINVTGMLLYKDGNFLQILEGEKENVMKLFDKISLDPRHTGVITIVDGDEEERQFPEWSMGFRDLNSPEVLSLPGYSDFLNTPFTGTEFSSNPTECQELLMIFKQNIR